MTTAAKITVAGAGFAALTGIKELRKQLPDADLTLVAPSAEFIYLPSLIWVPYGMRKGDDLRFDIVPLLNDLKVNFVQGSVTGNAAMAAAWDGRGAQMRVASCTLSTCCLSPRERMAYPMRQPLMACALEKV